MSVIVKECKPEDTMAKMEMERAVAKLKLGPKKDPNDLLNKSKKKAQILRLRVTQYSSTIATKSMIHCKNKKKLTTDKLLDEMHIQWRISGGKLKENKDSKDKDEIALAATNTMKGGKSPMAGQAKEGEP
jgi:hypothetical protein